MKKEVSQIYYFLQSFNTSADNGFTFEQLKKLYDAFCVLDFSYVVCPSGTLFECRDNAIKYCLDNISCECDLPDLVGSHSVTFRYYCVFTKTLL